MKSEKKKILSYRRKAIKGSVKIYEINYIYLTLAQSDTN